MAHRQPQEDKVLLMDQGWVKIQQRTFTRWCNTFLVERMMKIEDFCGDFTDGVQFCNLLEVISQKKLPKWNTKPRIKPQKLENVSTGLTFLQNEGIRLVGIGPQDVVDPKLNLILGLIWTIILRYQIQRGEDDGGSARSELLKWVRSKIPEYDIKNFGKDWNSGKAICALAEAVEPGQMKLPADFTNDPVRDATMGMNKAEENMGIPMVLYPEDMCSPDADELSVMTYISYFRDYENKRGDREAEARLRRTPVADQCRAYGPGLETGEALIPGIFIIEARNHLGELIPIGGHPFTSEVIAPDGSKINVQLEDNGDGTVNATYIPLNPGNHLVHVRLSGQDIGAAHGADKTSPFKVPISAAVADPTKTKIFGPGVEGGHVGKLAEFTVKTYNRFGNAIHHGGHPMTLNVDGPIEAAKPKQVLRDNENGEYDGNYLPILHGVHVVTVKLGEELVATCPIRVNIDRDPNAADASKSWAEILNEPTTLEPIQIRIHAVKPDGSPMDHGGEPFDVEALGPEGDVVPSSIKDNNDGTYDVEIVAEDPGAYKVDLFLRNKDIPNHTESIKDYPKTIIVESGVSAKNTICEGPGLQDGILDTQATHFNILTRDGKGRPCNEKGAGQPFKVEIQGPKGPVPATVTDNGDGTYRVDYEPTAAGIHKIEVTLKEEQVANSPYNVRVDAGAYYGTTNIESFSFVVRTKTRENENKTVGGESENFTIDITGPGDKVEPKLVDVGDGTYVVSYSLKQPGKYSISCQINKHDIQGSPFRQDF